LTYPTTVDRDQWALSRPGWRVAGCQLEDVKPNLVGRLRR